MYAKELEEHAGLRVRRALGGPIVSDEGPAIVGTQFPRVPFHSRLGPSSDGREWLYDAPLTAGSYVVTAVDAAGNESTPVTLSIGTCPALLSDASVSTPRDAPDTGSTGAEDASTASGDAALSPAEQPPRTRPNDDAEEYVTEDNDGGAVGPSRSGTALGSVGLVMMAFVLRGRRVAR